MPFVSDTTGAHISTEKDETLMLCYQQGDTAAFDALFLRHSPRILGFLSKHVGRSEAEDLMQTVFYKLHAHRDRYLPEHPFLPWLFTITRNLLTDFYRKQRAIPMEDDELERRLPSVSGTAMADVDNMQRFEQVVLGLPVDQRELLTLRIQEGLSFEEISERLGTNAPTVRKRMSRLIQKLKPRFRGLGDENEVYENK